MASPITDMAQQKAGRIAGFAWLIIIITGLFAEFFIRMPLLVPTDAAATVHNIAESQGLFRISIASDLIMLVFDIVVAVALYVVFKPINQGLALLAAALRLVMNAILGINLLNLVFALLLSTDPLYATVFESEQLQTLAILFVNAHSFGYDIGLVFFGLHLFTIGYLIYESGYVPRILGGLLITASFGYLIDSFASILLSQGEAILSAIASVLLILALVAELAIALWLLVKGIHFPQQQAAKSNTEQ
ncbi:MAG: DUF4386 domain-containing protein [Cyanobacteria bacterium J06638_20]